MNAWQRQQALTTPLGECIEQRGIMATATALAIAAIGASAGGPVASAALSSRGNTKAAKSTADAATSAAQLSADASTKAAEIQAGSAKEALDFTKEQDVQDRLAADKSARLNYGQWAEQQRRIGTLGSMLGLGGRDPAPYDSVISPSGSSGGGTGGGGDTMPGAGEVDWTAAPNVLGQQLNAYFTKRGVSTSETPYWVSKAAELVARGKEINDPNYASTRLAQSDVFGGGGGTATTPGKKIAVAPKTGLGAYATASYRAPSRYVQTPTLEQQYGSGLMAI